MTDGISNVCELINFLRSQASSTEHCSFFEQSSECCFPINYFFTKRKTMRCHCARDFVDINIQFDGGGSKNRLYQMNRRKLQP